MEERVEHEIEQTVQWLGPLYSDPSALHLSSLNTALRESLQLLAAKLRLDFKQDNVGNIYITRRGRDPEISPLAICFPLDGSMSPAAFDGAVRTFLFLALQGRSLTCDISLVGWSTPAGTSSSSSLGQDLWEGHISLADGYAQWPDLMQFSSMNGVSSFSLSALFEIVITLEPSVSVRGGPVLVQKALQSADQIDVTCKPQTQMQTRTQTQTQTQAQSSGRAPAIRIAGREAGLVGRKTVELYSQYVAALFDNFD